MDFEALTVRRFLIIAVAAFLWAGSGCLQLESPRTLAEEEDLRVRDKNNTQTREMLEEKIRRELDHIRFLQKSLELTVTEEETTTKELGKVRETLATLNGDRDALEKEKVKKTEELKPIRAELVKLQAELEAAKAKNTETRNSIAAEQKRTAVTE